MIHVLWKWMHERVILIQMSRSSLKLRPLDDVRTVLARPAGQHVVSFNAAN